MRSPLNQRILLTVMFLFITVIAFTQSKSNEKYVCIPCGNSCDSNELAADGQCAHCNMELVPKSSIKHKSVSPDKVCEFIKSKPGIVLLDVRTKEEFNGTAEANFGTLKNAINIPIDELQTRISELNAYKGKTILVFCSHSHRSPRVSYLLTQNNFKDVVNMEGGMSVMTDSRCKK
jgi:rhodanese-related sulfurtransferase